MRLRDLLRQLGNYRIYNNKVDFEVSGISCNSRDVRDNFVFVAVKGTQADGHKFIKQAQESGARAVIIDARQYHRLPNLAATTVITVKDTRAILAKLAAEFYNHPCRNMKAVAITGTNGKTTVSYLIEALLRQAGLATAVLGTVNYRFKGKVLPSKNTTPGPVELQSLLAKMRSEGVNYVVMEVSSHALDQGRTEGINFSSAIFTNLTQDHLDYHKTINNYFLAKAKLFKGLGLNARAIINNDDPYAGRIKRLTKARIFTYAINSRADVSASDIKFDMMHTQFTLNTARDKISLKTRLIGIHNVYNILAAACWGIQEGLSLKVIKSAIADSCCVPGRLEMIDSGSGPHVFIDYAHTHDALNNVIRTLRQLSARRLIVVFGCGGQRDRGKRPKMGRVVSELADYAIITNDNPRCEDPRRIIRDITKGIKKDNYCIITDRRKAIRKSLSISKDGDIVLIAGKGHEACQIIKDKIIPFNDREVVRECLRSMNY